MSGTDEPRHPGAIPEDSDTDDEEVPATTAVSDTEETPVTTAPLPRDSRGRFVRRIPAPDPLPHSRSQTPLLLLPSIYHLVPYPISLLQLGSYLPAQIPQWTHQQVQRPVPLLPNLLKRKVNNLQIQVNTPILPSVVLHRPTNSVQFPN